VSAQLVAAGYTVDLVCQVLDLARSSYYFSPVPAADEHGLKDSLEQVAADWPTYGYRRLTKELARKQVHVNAKRVRRLMRALELTGKKPRKRTATTDSRHHFARFPNLVAALVIDRPDQVWVGDITYIRLLTGWLYLVAVLDWYSRYVLAWELSDTLELPFVLACARAALAQAVPQIWNSDQGSHFTSPQYVDLLLGQGVLVSMDGHGRARDNIFTERLWRTVKYEEVYLTEYANPREARHGLSRYFPFYNCERPHQALAYQTPAVVYFR